MIDLRPYCVAQWKMNDNESSAIVLDSSGNSYHGTAQQDTSVLHASGKVRSALSFNGTSDYIDTGRTFATTFQKDFTVSCWIKPDDGKPASTEENIFLGVLDELSKGVEIWHYAFGGKSYITAYYHNGNEYVYFSSTGNIMSDGQQGWHYLMVDFSTTSGCHMYFDNALVGNAASITNMSDYAVTLNARIGEIQDQEIYSKMDIDNFCIFNKILLDTERDFLYNNGNGTELLYERQTRWPDYRPESYDPDLEWDEETGVWINIPKELGKARQQLIVVGQDGGSGNGCIYFREI